MVNSYTSLTGEYCGKKTCKTTNNNGPQNISKLNTVFCFGASRDLKIFSYKRNLVVFFNQNFWEALRSSWALITWQSKFISRAVISFTGCLLISSKALPSMHNMNVNKLFLIFKMHRLVNVCVIFIVVLMSQQLIW